MLRRVSSLSLLLTGLCCGATGAADIARGLREVELDPGECYRVHDLKIDKDDIHLYLTDGYLIFAKPVSDSRTAAVFTSEVEAGDAELLLLPPDRSERRSLANYTGSPNLDEHLNAAILLFGDNTADDLIRQIGANEFNRRIPEAGAMMADQWTRVVRNLSASFESRLLLDLLAGHHQHGCFFAAVEGRKLGNFDVIYEPRSVEQITIGQVASRNNLTFFDFWTSFTGAPYRKGARKPPATEFSLNDYRINATLEPGLLLRVATQVKVTLNQTERVLPFEITGKMQVSSATIDGQPAEVLQPESLRSNLVRNDGNSLFLVVAPQPLPAGSEHEVEFHHEGSVVLDTGNRIYYIGPRSSWYPNLGLQFARYDLSFRYPKDLDLVTAGDVVSDQTEGEWRTTRRVIQAPMRFAGFNLGVYDRAKAVKGEYTVEVCANRATEAALRSKPPADAATPNPPARLEQLASEVASALDFMAAHFGPPPLKTLEVSPIPGAFGQGFPGLLYLSTMTYLRREDELMANLNPHLQSFFSDVLQAHETAHQWWGNVVATASYHDEWLMEALANYSALMYLEQRDGRQLLDAALEAYRTRLLARNANGRTVESTGPIVLGARLTNSLSPAAWNTITYGKGSWILHMLRARMGGERFLAMLGELRRRYEWKTISTDEFRRLAVEFMPPQSPDPKLETFFDQWVYGTGVPALKLSYSIHGGPHAVKLTGTVSQSDVDADFNAEVPVDIECGSERQVKWVRTAGGAAQFTASLPQAPTRVTLDTSNILAVAR